MTTTPLLDTAYADEPDLDPARHERAHAEDDIDFADDW